MLTAVIAASAFGLSYAVIPRPVQIEPRDGQFPVRDITKIFAEPGLENEASYLSDHLGGMKVVVAKSADPIAGSILLTTQGSDQTLNREGYVLDVTGRSVKLSSPKKAGVFRGIQTILQLLQPGDGGATVVPAVHVRDYPRFQWRGMHLDVARHFFPVDAIKQYIDTLAFFKMNVFHWHLTDDQGWRIEIKKYPKLTEVSSWRDETLGRPGTNRPGDGIKYGGFYTQDEIREIVDYAAKRHVTVVPEIEMPGHSVEVLAAYPDLACDTPDNLLAREKGENPFAVSTTWGVKPDILCGGKDASLKFMEDVLDEVLDLFPSPFIHIGGDEAPKNRWKQCPTCQKRIADLGLKDEDELQSWFTQQIDNYLTSKGRRLVGWDEILQGGIADNATVMSWRGVNGGIAAARSGHDAVMTPNGYCYLDYYQSKQQGEPEAIGGLIDLAKAYSYEPVPAALSPDEAKHILGVQGNVWTEYIADVQQMEYMAWPRGAAIAEIGWTPPDLKDFNDFSARWDAVSHCLTEMGVNFFAPRDEKAVMPVNITTTMTPLKDHPPVCAFDGDINSEFVTDSGVKAGDTFTLVFPETKSVKQIEFRFGPLGEMLRGGAVEVSMDGLKWGSLGEFKGSHFTVATGLRRFRQLRLHITTDAPQRLVIREITLK
ncbi:MAG TPA: beta-N-acetylhexosaminidase [Fimbriimonadaceae bacterium]|nr:beta-N-acetylhexosaminidase [Fimbriimonadaceae bacterium]